MLPSDKTSKIPPSLFIHVTQEELDQVLSLRNQAQIQISDPVRQNALFVASMVHFLGLDKKWIPRLMDPEEHWQLLCDTEYESAKQRISTIH